MYNSQKVGALVWCYVLLSFGIIKSAQKPQQRYENIGTLHRCIKQVQLPWYAGPMSRYLVKNLTGALIGGETEQYHAQEVCKQRSGAMDATDCSIHRSKILYALQQCKDNVVSE
jgi:hypothetical protein